MVWKISPRVELDPRSARSVGHELVLILCTLSDHVLYLFHEDISKDF